MLLLYSKICANILRKLNIHSFYEKIVLSSQKHKICIFCKHKNTDNLHEKCLLLKY